MSDKLAVRLISGYICAALFLPMVMMGMQYGFVALYSMQLESLGYVTLFPTLAMAGAGQVGAGIALFLLAKKSGNRPFSGVISAAIIPGMMGVGNPLLFGVTLPMGRPFITAGLGAGWGPSGLLALPLVTAGPNGALKSMVFYFLGLCISCLMGFLITRATVDEKAVANM